jgi:hypothetical protein
VLIEADGLAPCSLSARSPQATSALAAQRCSLWRLEAEWKRETGYGFQSHDQTKPVL